jgi:hypothetical protein
MGACVGGAWPEPLEPCEGSIQPGLRYEPFRFEWSPGCGISRLAVTELPVSPGESERVVWAFTVPEHVPLAPAITYGEAPSQADVWTGPEPLVSGRRYHIYLSHTVGGDVVVASGGLTFTWIQPD